MAAMMMSAPIDVGTVLKLKKSASIDDEISMISETTSNYMEDFHKVHSRSSSENNEFSLLSDEQEVHQAPCLVGRREEISLLQESLEEVIEKGTSIFVSVKGESGSGKTHLIETMRETFVERGGFFCCGKFDSSIMTSIPFAALSAAFSDVVDFCLHLPLDDQQQIKDNLKMALGNQVAVLKHFISNLYLLLGHLEDGGVDVDGTPSSSFDSQFQSTTKHSQAFDSFQLLCQKFLRTVSSDFPVLLFLDDLQWASKESLQLLKSLCMDSKSHRILVIASYRPHNFDTYNKDLDQFLGTEFFFSTKALEIHNFTPDQVETMLCHLLQGSRKQQNFESDIEELANVVFQKTSGNPYHVVSFMDSIRRTGLIKKSDDSSVWTWDTDLVRSETSLSENVADLVVLKIGKLHPFVQGVLKVASLLGFRFEIGLLETVVYNMFCQNKDEEEASVILQGVIQVSINQGLLEVIGDSDDGFLRFTHDRVQTTLYELLENDDAGGNSTKTLHLQIGRILLWQLQENRDDPDESLTFMVVEHLNRGLDIVTSPEEKTEICKLNLVASQFAIRRSAFQGASNYIGVGILLLEEKEDQTSFWDPSSELYSLALRVYSCASESYCSGGQFDLCEAASNVVIENAINILDKMPVYFSMVDALASQDKFSDALDLGLQVLAQLGEKVPRRAKFTHTGSEMARVAALLHKKSDDDLIGLPPMSEPQKQSATRLMLVLSMIAFFNQENLYYPYLWLRSMRMTLQHGRDRATAPIFATYGIINSIMGRYEAAYRFGALATKMSTQAGRWDDQSITIVLVNCFTSHWKKPIYSLVATFDKAYEQSMATGNTNFAVLAGISRLEADFVAGATLQQVEEQCEQACIMLKALNKKAFMKACLPIWQAVLNLMGGASEETGPLVLTGDVMTESDIVEDDCRSGYDLAISNAQNLKLWLACFFQDWDACLEMTQIIRRHPEIYFGLQAHFFSLSYTLFSGVAYFNLSRRSWRRRHLAKGKQALNRSKKWAEDGAPDAIPIYKLLTAEHTVASNSVKVLVERHATVKAEFDEAIVAYRKSGHVQFEALANERAGTILMELEQGSDGVSFLEEARRLYLKWGAVEKAEQIGNRLFLSQ